MGGKGRGKGKGEGGGERKGREAGKLAPQTQKPNSAYARTTTHGRAWRMTTPSGGLSNLGPLGYSDILRAPCAKIMSCRDHGAKGPVHGRPLKSRALN
jgi:hypothetical protein